MTKKDMQSVVGKTYNYLKILEVVDKPNGEKYKCWNHVNGIWVKCECKCGNTVILPFYVIENNSVKSCGCYHVENGLKHIAKIHELYPPPQNAKLITYNGITLNIKHWAERTGINRCTLMYRLKKGLPLDEVFRGGKNLNGDIGTNQQSG